MKPLTGEWTRKAEGDHRAARRLARARKPPNHDEVCFHAQQCAEKYMKAVLEEHGRQVPRIHDLPALLDELIKINGIWDALRQAAKLLSEYAVRVRYPGAAATKATATRALRACEFVRAALREALGCRTQARRRKRRR